MGRRCLTPALNPLAMAAAKYTAKGTASTNHSKLAVRRRDSFFDTRVAATVKSARIAIGVFSRITTME